MAKPNHIQRTSALVKVTRPSPPPNAIQIYQDAPRARFGFGVASSSSGRIYKISFDDAPGALYWRCSCPAGISRGYCKHLQACGLKGRADMPRQEGLDFAKKHGLLQ